MCSNDTVVTVLLFLMSLRHFLAEMPKLFQAAATQLFFSHLLLPKNASKKHCKIRSDGYNEPAGESIEMARNSCKFQGQATLRGELEETR